MIRQLKFFHDSAHILWHWHEICWIIYPENNLNPKNKIYQKMFLEEIGLEYSGRHLHKIGLYTEKRRVYDNLF